MGDNTITNKTNAELGAFITECEEKYQKLLKVAKKLGNEMDTLHEQYMTAKTELNKRQNIKNSE